MNKNTFPSLTLHINKDCISYKSEDNVFVQYIGADFPQIVDGSLKIHIPLCDTSVILSFKCEIQGKILEKDFPLLIKGKYGLQKKKPIVVPEPAQWYASGGVFKTIMTFSCENEADGAANLFAETYKKMLGQNIVFSEHADIHFQLENALSYLGEEGYEIVCCEQGITVSAFSETGLIWAGKTICQIMLQGAFPCGIMRDYPRYSVRGFMLDVARRPVSMEMLEKIVDRMAWYKMNDFQIHLNDNYIWLEDYAENGESDTFDAYQAFRLECGLKNDKGESPTAEDYHYSKREFSRFIQNSLKKGVHITPEIDVPAHALSFSRVFPEYAVKSKVSEMMKKRPLTDHIDISDPKAVEFVKDIFDEYISGEAPAFPKGTIIHIGADEFLADYGAYRRFLNTMIPYLKKTNTVRLWGSLSLIKDTPETPIVKEAVEDVQMNLWSSDWADGREMYDMGYQLINTIDCRLYIVPNGTRVRAPYMDYINKRKVFKDFEPNSVRLKDTGKFTRLPAGNKQMLGSCFAIWQDNIDKRCKGINEQDLYDRFDDCVALLSEKNWGSCSDKNSVNSIESAVRCIQRGFCRNRTCFAPVSNVYLKGAGSFIETDCNNLPVGSVLKLSFRLDEVIPNQIFMESDAPYGTYDLRITKNSKLGFTAQGYEYEFDYTLVPNKKMTVFLDTKPLCTRLKSGLFKRKKARGSFAFNGSIRCDAIKNSTFSIPTARIGSKTNSVKGCIYDISVK